MAYAHCRIQFGVAHAVEIYSSVQPAGPSIDFRTGDFVLPSPLPAPGNRLLWTGTQTEGATDGTLAEDFKSPKARGIIQRTERLLNRGVIHGGTEFAANENIRSRLSIISISSVANPTFWIPDVKNAGYDIVDASDFNDLVDAVATRLRLMTTGNTSSSGEADLIALITAAANTQVAMDAISDTRS